MSAQRLCVFGVLVICCEVAVSQPPPIPAEEWCFYDESGPVYCGSVPNSVSCGSGGLCVAGECPAPPAGKVRETVTLGPDGPDPNDPEDDGYLGEHADRRVEDGNGNPAFDDGYAIYIVEYVCYVRKGCKCQLRLNDGVWENQCVTDNNADETIYQGTYQIDQEWPCEELGAPSPT